MNSEFPSSNLLNPDEFLKYVKLRGIFLTKNNLEYYDKSGVLRPVLKVITPNIENNIRLRNSYSSAHIYTLQHYYSEGLIEFPNDGDYMPWSNYDEYDNIRSMYYHPYQLLQAVNIATKLNWQLTTLDIEDRAKSNFNSYDLREHIIQTIEKIKKSIIKDLIPLIGLLMLLDNFYGPLVKKHTPVNMYDMINPIEGNIKKQKWINEFSFCRILLLSGMSVERIKGYYEIMSWEAEEIDPLVKWFPFLQLIKGWTTAKIKEGSSACTRLLWVSIHDFLFHF